jgi:hypothetical protein
MKIFFYLFFAILGFCGLIHADTHVVKLGDTQVKIKVLRHVKKGKTFIHLHQNEVTALEAAKFYVAREGGAVITLKHSGQRNIVFYLKGMRYEFDPNRIFTDRGIIRTLKQFGSYSRPAHLEVKKFASKILMLLPADKIIAVHNNKTFSMKDYLPKHSLAHDAKAIHYLPKTSSRNFYMVTQRKDYNRLKKLHFNVVLQADHAQDDGSLSYYLSKKKYINIECGYGELSAQMKMLGYA